MNHILTNVVILRCVFSFIFLACTTHPVKKKSCGFQRYDFELLVQ